MYSTIDCIEQLHGTSLAMRFRCTIESKMFDRCCADISVEDSFQQ